MVGMQGEMYIAEQVFQLAEGKPNGIAFLLRD
jgi:hypothetical protein